MQGTKAKNPGAFPLPKPRAVAEAICGAPAQAQAAAAEHKAAQQKDEEETGLASASDWEVCHCIRLSCQDQTRNGMHPWTVLVLQCGYTIQSFSIGSNASIGLLVSCEKGDVAVGSLHAIPVYLRRYAVGRCSR